MAGAGQMAELRIFDSREAASTALADRIAGVLEAAIKQQGNASLVVSGGTSPLTTFHLLQQKKLPWRNVIIVPSDERLVPIDHEDSNEGMIRREFLQKHARAAHLLSLAEAGHADDKALLNLDSRPTHLARPLDMVVLGMGDDGHTASLFPNSPDIGYALESNDCCVVQHPAHLDTARLTLTPVFLLDSNEIILLFFGDKKRAVYDRALTRGTNQTLPIRFVLHQKVTPVTVFWSP